MQTEADTDALISVVIPMYNAEDVIGQQLDALANQTYNGPWEVVVADNGCEDGSVRVVEGFADTLPNLRIVPAADRKGAAHARNVGSRAAIGEIIAYADADDIVSPGWLAALARPFDQHDFVAGWSDPIAADGTLGGSSVDHVPKGALPRSFGFLPWALGGNCAVRRSVFDEVGGWDENYPHGGDDVDFCWRVQLAGYPLFYAPGARVGYRPRPTLRTLAKQQFEFGARSPLLLREYKSHGARRRTLRQVAATWIGIIVRLPYVLFPRRRRTWVANAAGAAGRVWGSIRWRTLGL